MFKKIWFAGFSVFFSISAAASDSIYVEELPLVWAPIITLSGGPVWAQPGKNQFLYPPNPVGQIDHFRYTSKSGILASGEIFFGLQRFIVPGLMGQLGLGIAGATNAKATGVISVNGVPDVNAFDYKVDHGRLELKGKLITTYSKLVQPYISGSFGAGFNNSHAYVPTSINQALYPAAWYGAKTNIAFSYTLGLGLQTMICPHWQVGVGYEFADWGKNYLGPDTNRVPQNIITYGPGLPHLYTNELLFSVSYLY